MFFFLTDWLKLTEFYDLVNFLTKCVGSYSSLISSLFLHARASEQGNVIGLVSVYICVYVRSCVHSCHQKKIVIERTRDLIYLKFVATDFFPKTISPSAGENSGDLA